jgi:SAM-dependent methyltransferase
MPLSTAQWHTRYTRQAGWTAGLRSYLFERHNIASAKWVLDCGSGTGALEAGDGLGSSFRGILVGLDINRLNLAYAKSLAIPATCVQGDGLQLPFTAESFDIVFCHFFLLWVSDPLQALRELRRVTRQGGSVIALAEPDYGGRIDFPPELETLASWQQASLRHQGANPLLGVGGASERPGGHAWRRRELPVARRVQEAHAAGRERLGERRAGAVRADLFCQR